MKKWFLIPMFLIATFPTAIAATCTASVTSCGGTISTSIPTGGSCVPQSGAFFASLSVYNAAGELVDYLTLRCPPDRTIVIDPC